MGSVFSLVFPSVHPHVSQVVVLSWGCSLSLHLGKLRPKVPAAVGMGMGTVEQGPAGGKEEVPMVLGPYAALLLLQPEKGSPKLGSL